MRIAVASQMFHGLLIVYGNSVIENPGLFAQQALDLADSLLTSDAHSPAPRRNGPPSQATPLHSQEDTALAKLIVAQNDGLLCEIRSRRDGKRSADEGQTIH